MEEQIGAARLREMVVAVVSAYVSRNTVASEDLPPLITDVYASLAELATGAGAEQVPVPAVSVKRSVTPDYIVCLEDGKKLKMLKRHLKTVYDLTPEQYRERWNLPASYPLVAPNYAKQRSRLAKKIGLGRRAES